MTADASAGKTPLVVTSLTGDKGEDPTDSDLAALINESKKAVAAEPSAPVVTSPSAGAVSAPRAAQDPAANGMPETRVVLMHFLEDGFTAFGQVWYRGQELEITIPGRHYELTKGIDGVSWLDELLGPQNEMKQARKFGKVMFREGPWPGDRWESPEAQAAELARRRQPPAMALPTAALR